MEKVTSKSKQRFNVKNILKLDGKTAGYLVEDRTLNTTYAVTRIALLELIGHNMVEDTTAKKIRNDYYATGINVKLNSRTKTINIKHETDLYTYDQIIKEKVEPISVTEDDIINTEMYRPNKSMRTSPNTDKIVVGTQLTDKEAARFRRQSELSKTGINNKTANGDDHMVQIGYAAEVPMYWNAGKRPGLLIERSTDELEYGMHTYLANSLIKSEIAVIYIQTTMEYKLQKEITSKKGFMLINDKKLYEKTINKLYKILNNRVDNPNREQILKEQRIALIIDDIETLYMGGLSKETKIQITYILANALGNNVNIIVGACDKGTEFDSFEKKAFHTRAGSLGTNSYKSTERLPGLSKVNRGQEYGIIDYNLRHRIRFTPEYMEIEREEKE